MLLTSRKFQQRGLPAPLLAQLAYALATVASDIDLCRVHVLHHAYSMDVSSTQLCDVDKMVLRSVEICANNTGVTTSGDNNW
jgi:hypothetical protein